MKTGAKLTKSKNSQKQPDSVPFHRKPGNLSLEHWQIALRKQFVQGRNFGIRKHEGHPVFSDYTVYNPETKNTYKVALRDNSQQMNFCSCLDFKTNHLGTCKHIEAVILKINEKPQLASLLKKGYTPPYSSVYLRYGKERTVKLRVGTTSSSRIRRIAANFFDDNNCLNEYGFRHFEKFRAQASEIDPDFRCYEDAFEYILSRRNNQYRLDTVNQRYPREQELDGLIKTRLFPYQKTGILFAAKAGRSLICDEMGLGKTIQAIGTAELMKQEFGIGNVLVVCPTSLKYQWESEIKRFTSASVNVIEGLPHLRKQQYLSGEFYKIVSYNTLNNDIQKINEGDFDLVILDEAQRIKNWKTKIAQSVKKIRSLYALVLTGTPLENKLEELYSIVQFVDPFKLGPYYRFLDRYQVKNDTGRVIGYDHLHEIKEKLSDVMIRRNKAEVLSQLPERTDKTLFVTMTDKQMELHHEFREVVARLIHKWRTYGFLSELDRQRLMINLNLMRMVCDSTYILDQETRFDTKIDELICILEEYFEGNNEKVVIFSQWERMTRIVAKELETRDIGFQYLHGGVPAKDRKSLFDHFNNEPDCRVFLSTDAGSTGLNLQTASMIINLDIPWNPAVLEQRIGRVHRYGQKNKVSVINFVSTGTIEHRMLDVLKFKTSLFEGILNNGEDSIFLADDKFREFMRSVEELTSATEDMQEVSTVQSADFESESILLNQPESIETVQTKADYQEEFIPGDDDIAMEEHSEQVVKAAGSHEVPPAPEPAELISSGMNFLNGLFSTFSSPDATQKLVSSLVQTDPDTGKSYLKIPVENEAVVSNALNVIGQIFSMVQKMK